MPLRHETRWYRAKKCVLLFSLLWKNQRAFLFSPPAAARLFFHCQSSAAPPQKKKGGSPWQNNWKRSMTPSRSKTAPTNSGWIKTTSTPMPKAKRNPTPSSFRPPISPASCIWGTRWIIPSRMPSSAGAACRATRPCGCPAPITPPSPPRPRSWKPCARKASPRRRSDARAFWSAPGNGAASTANR